MHYGLKTSQQARQLAREVVSVLGGGEPAYSLLVETAAAETLLGSFPDVHEDRLGVGLCQHDEINLKDIKQEGEQRHFNLIKQHWGYDVPSLELADLAYDPLLSLILCRLSYKRIPAAIPADLRGRAEYWKEYYNTAAGKGSVNEYLHRVLHCLGEDWA